MVAEIQVPPVLDRQFQPVDTRHIDAHRPRRVAAAQRAFTHRAKMNGLAALRQWKQDMEKKAA